MNTCISSQSVAIASDKLDQVVTVRSPCQFIDFVAIFMMVNSYESKMTLVVKNRVKVAFHFHIFCFSFNSA